MTASNFRKRRRHSLYHYYNMYIVHVRLLHVRLTVSVQGKSDTCLVHHYIIVESIKMLSSYMYMYIYQYMYTRTCRFRPNLSNNYYIVLVGAAYCTFICTCIAFLCSPIVPTTCICHTLCVTYMSTICLLRLFWCRLIQTRICEVIASVSFLFLQQPCSTLQIVQVICQSKSSYHNFISFASMSVMSFS